MEMLVIQLNDGSQAMNIGAVLKLWGSHLLRMVTLLALVAGPSWAADVEEEPARATSPGDPAIEWGPCPEFLPEGCALAVLHGDPTQSGADLFMRIPAGALLPMHWHTSAERMTLSQGELRVTYAGQPEAVLHAGDYAYGPPKRPHQAYCASVTPCMLFIAFNEPVDAIAVNGHLD